MNNTREKELVKIKNRLKELLVDNLSLNDVSIQEIADDEILFGGGLCLDSLDAVEIAVLLQRNYGLKVKDMKQGHKIFYSIETLADFVYENTKPQSGS